MNVARSNRVTRLEKIESGIKYKFQGVKLGSVGVGDSCIIGLISYQQPSTMNYQSSHQQIKDIPSVLSKNHQKNAKL
ncbi:MAG: hypothetical protein F6J89_00735 [Symploca sp. SIO1C4]|uniref:Uncharacterized protein n=1 Tax=Symploca sp. SIO1C4 TaxID=2607765 RepID=A0A6B3NAJ5_9CYAN|nr:hypothetical protein [Symploca sp. SIO1C4]